MVKSKRNLSRKTKNKKYTKAKYNKTKYISRKVLRGGAAVAVAADVAAVLDEYKIYVENEKITKFILDYFKYCDIENNSQKLIKETNLNNPGKKLLLINKCNIFLLVCFLLNYYSISNLQNELNLSKQRAYFDLFTNLILDNNDVNILPILKVLCKDDNIKIMDYAIINLEPSQSTLFITTENNLKRIKLIYNQQKIQNFLIQKNIIKSVKSILTLLNYNYNSDSDSHNLQKNFNFNMELKFIPNIEQFNIEKPAELAYSAKLAEPAESAESAELAEIDKIIAQIAQIA